MNAVDKIYEQVDKKNNLDESNKMRQVKNGVVTGRGDGPYSVRDRKDVTFLLVDRFLSIISISNLVTLKKKLSWEGK